MPGIFENTFPENQNYFFSKIPFEAVCNSHFHENEKLSWTHSLPLINFLCGKIWKINKNFFCFWWLSWGMNFRKLSTMFLRWRHCQRSFIFMAKRLNLNFSSWKPEVDSCVNLDRGGQIIFGRFLKLKAIQEFFPTGCVLKYD